MFLIACMSDIGSSSPTVSTNPCATVRTPKCSSQATSCVNYAVSETKSKSNNSLLVDVLSGHTILQRYMVSMRGSVLVAVNKKGMGMNDK